MKQEEQESQSKWLNCSDTWENLNWVVNQVLGLGILQSRWDQEMENLNRL